MSRADRTTPSVYENPKAKSSRLQGVASTVACEMPLYSSAMGTSRASSSGSATKDMPGPCRWTVWTACPACSSGGDVPRLGSADCTAYTCSAASPSRSVGRSLSGLAWAVLSGSASPSRRRSCSSFCCTSLKRDHPACQVEGWDTRRACTAVTLYSGQLVAQSELSVVTTLAPDSGKWNVV